jgi:cytochrome c oxidase cbb3-type subunit III
MGIYTGWEGETIMMRPRLLTRGVLIAAGLGLAAWTVGLWSPQGLGPTTYCSEIQAVPAAEKAAHAEGHRLYAKFCIACHGADGKGTVMRKQMPAIPDFTDGKWQDSLSNAQLQVGIMEGKGTLMPPYREALSDEQVKDLVGCIREFGAAAAGAPK